MHLAQGDSEPLASAKHPRYQLRFTAWGEGGWGLGFAGKGYRLRKDQPLTPKRNL